MSRQNVPIATRAAIAVCRKHSTAVRGLSCRSGETPTPTQRRSALNHFPPYVALDFMAWKAHNPLRFCLISLSAHYRLVAQLASDLRRYSSRWLAASQFSMRRRLSSYFICHVLTIRHDSSHESSKKPLAEAELNPKCDSSEFQHYDAAFYVLHVVHQQYLTATLRLQGLVSANKVQRPKKRLLMYGGNFHNHYCPNL